MIFFLAAVTFRLCRRVLGADNPSFGAVMGKRGDASGSGATTVAASAPGTLRRCGRGGGGRGGAPGGGAPAVGAPAAEPRSRCARAVGERVGASPRARSAASSAGKST